MKLKQILNEMITKSELKKLTKGSTIWVLWHKNRPAEQVEFIEFIPKSGSLVDRIISKDINNNINNDVKNVNGLVELPLKFYYLEDPENETGNVSKRGFLHKGVHGQRKWK